MNYKHPTAHFEFDDICNRLIKVMKDQNT